MPPRRTLSATAGSTSSRGKPAANARRRVNDSTASLPLPLPPLYPPPLFPVRRTTPPAPAIPRKPSLRPPVPRPPSPSEGKAHNAPVPAPTETAIAKKNTINLTRAAQPTRDIFDPWNSVALGHQRAENRLAGSTSWRDSRTRKLTSQFGAGPESGGGDRLYDTVGAGSENFGRDGRTANGGWVKGASGLRGAGQKSIVEIWGAKVGKAGARGRADVKKQGKRTTSDDGAVESTGDIQTTASISGRASLSGSLDAAPHPAVPQIFAGTTIYINGSTYPTISDHKLKHILVTHGAHHSIALARRAVTHVIIGRPNSARPSHGTSQGPRGCGGGLAGGKMQKEITSIRGKGVKFVGVEWVVESVKAGRRLPEARFRVMELGGERQRSVHGMLGGGIGGESMTEDSMERLEDRQ